MFYPGRIEGWRRPTHETRLTLDIKPSARVTLRPVVEYEFTEYKFKDQIDGAQEIADFTRIGYGASVDILLASETVWTLNYMRQDITTETLANTKTSSAGVNPFTGAPNAGYLGALIQKFDASYDTLSSVLTHTWKKLTLGVNAGLTNGEGNWDTHYYWAGLGADYRISRNVSANAGYTYYRYYEDNNGGVNNYFANALQLGMRVRF
jgi:opacity protein-like surface antigen